MILLHNVGPKYNGNYNTPEQILRCNEPISFDGVYLNVWEHREILKPKLKGAILFVMGKYVGKDNTFDVGQRYEKYCDWNKIMDLVVNYGCELGWHTWSHPSLPSLSEQQIYLECKPPIPMKYFAHPYGDCNDKISEILLSLNYQEAWSVVQGNGSVFQRKRKYL